MLRALNIHPAAGDPPYFAPTYSARTLSMFALPTCRRNEISLKHHKHNYIYCRAGDTDARLSGLFTPFRDFQFSLNSSQPAENSIPLDQKILSDPRVKTQRQPQARKKNVPNHTKDLYSKRLPVIKMYISNNVMI